jgi:DNA polymerase-3 subunit gamma/tau
VETLALTHRPTSFEDLIGQRPITAVLRQMVLTNRVPTALLFKGRHGTGKTSTARILAAALNCETPPGPCGHCVSCKSIFNATSLDLIEIDAASNGRVEDIRELRQQVLYAVGGRFRVVVLDEAQSMSTAAFNALLKTLEEPPPAAVFILATTEANRIPDTVTSRCMPFAFSRVSVADITARLAHICRQEDIPADSALLATLAESADGAMRDAIMSLDQLRRADILTLAAYRALTGDLDYGPDLLAAIVAGDTAATFGTLDEILTRVGDVRAVATELSATLRDLLIVQAGGQLPAQGRALSVRTDLARRLTTQQVFSALKVLWELALRICGSQTERSVLELAILMISERCGAPAAPAPAAPVATKLTLAQMAAAR